MRVLVVDDSAFQRVTLSAALSEMSAVSAVETAASGEEAIRKVLSSRFDLVTLDIEMPGMDGFAVLRWLMVNHPLPVVVVSGRKREATAVLALELGAFEVLGKASARSGGMAAWKPLLASAVEQASHLRVDLLSIRARSAPAGERPRGTALPATAAALEPPALVVGASTGGPPALRDLFLALEPRPVIVGVAQHIPGPFARSLAQRLSSATGWEAREAVDGAEARPGVIHVAPGTRHMALERERGRVYTRLVPAGPPLRWCPSADLLFESAARAFGPRVVALVLTGMGDDGAEGARAVHRAGGVVLCEARESAVIAGMPEAAARAVPTAARAPLASLGAAVARRLESL